TKTFLRSLQAYSNPGRLKNLRYDVEEIHRHQAGRQALSDVASLQDLVTHLGTVASYLSTAEAVLPSDHAWVEHMKTARSAVLGQVGDPGKRATATFRQQTLRRLTDLKKAYVQAYLSLHLKARLGVNEDKRKIRLTRDERLQLLQKLSTIDLMPRQHLTEFQKQLGDLTSCFALTEQELDTTP